MTDPTAPAVAFVREVCALEEVWTIWDGEGFPTATTASGDTAIPFWSTERRARALIESAGEYGDYHPRRIPLETFLGDWIPAFERQDLRVGMNWEGLRAIGHDAPAANVAAAIRAVRGERDG